MAFVVLRRTRNTRSYYLVESYRDAQGRTRKRTLCYLGREQDGTDTPDKALKHWRLIKKQTERELASATRERQRILRARIAEIEVRIGRLLRLIEDAAHAQAERERQRQAEEKARRQWAEELEKARRQRAEELEHWQAIDRLQRHPSAEHAQAAKRAFRVLALQLHPDQGGSHEAFVRLKNTYDRATDAWRRIAG